MEDMQLRNEIIVVGGGLAGCEAAYQIAKKGIKVKLYEMKPVNYSPAHSSENLAEIVCSNSFKSNLLTNACGLLKEELRKMNSLLIKIADETSVPAGQALAVDRDIFSEKVTETIEKNPNIEIIRNEVGSAITLRELAKNHIVIIATGPLTSDNLSKEILEITGENDLHFFDAAAQIIEKNSINVDIAFYGDRYEEERKKDETEEHWRERIANYKKIVDCQEKNDVFETGSNEKTVDCEEKNISSEVQNTERTDTGSYINLPMNKEEYENFYNELVNAEKVTLHDFEKKEIFEGCMPVEVMATRGKDTLRFGPLKPVGFDDPRTGRRPYALIQLRQDNSQATLYNLVGFQTNLKFGEQKRVFSMIPGLENAEFAKYGVMHRNTYINSTKLLDSTYNLKQNNNIYFAGQITGVEGYVESISSGLVAGINAANQLISNILNEKIYSGEKVEDSKITFDENTVIGALAKYISTENEKFQPMNANFGILPPLNEEIRDKKLKYQKMSERSLKLFENKI